MGFFRPYERTETDKSAKPRTLTPKDSVPKRDAASEPEPANAVAPSSPHSARKSEPTPTRKAAEAARRERLHPTLTRKQAKRRASHTRRVQQQETWDKMERSPERALLRDFVDARWTVVEFMLPMMLVFLAATMLMSTPRLMQYAFWVTVLLWAFLIGSVVNIIMLWTRFKRELAERLPNATPRRLLMYLINRAMMIRRFRQPRPRISRGDSY